MAAEIAWVVSANMGLGHQRAVFPLRELAADRIFLFGEDFVTSSNEKRLWLLFRKSYEFLSRTGQIPIIGPSLFSLLERLQNISPYYPFRDQSQPSLQVKSLYSLIKKGMGHGLCSQLKSRPLPVITSFYSAAVAAEELTGLSVYCIICDADINRVWVAENPERSRIVYFAPCDHALRRLKEYGVPAERIHLTGFPLPHENIGGLEMPVLKADLGKRLLRLDPSNKFRVIHGEEVRFYLGDYWSEASTDQPLTITYAVGGAGAQTDIAGEVAANLAPLIHSRKIRLNLVAGVRSKVRNYFIKAIKKAGLFDNEGVRIIYQPEANDYFNDFNRILRTTDILWTKPSELIFYCGLGIPIIAAPCIGPHEVFNLQWLRELGAGIKQGDPKYCSEWIMDYLLEGHFAQAAWDGFLYAQKMGLYKIQEVLSTGTMSSEVSPLKR